MTSDDPFRIALLTIFGLHDGHRGSTTDCRRRNQASASLEKKKGFCWRCRCGWPGSCLWVGTLAYLINPAWMEWARLPLPDWLRWLGAMSARCRLPMYWTLTNLGKNLTDTVVTRANATLVTTGPYRWVRHPFYVTVVLLVVADSC